jgi:hypothetical protein
MINRRKPLIVAAVTTASVVAISLGATTFATADERTAQVDAAAGVTALVGAQAQRLMAAQAPLDDVADQIEAAAAKDPRSGIAGLEVNAKARSVRLYWKGDVSAAVSTVVSAAQGRGVQVDVLPGRYRRSDLMQEALQLADQPGVISATPNLDGSGVAVRSSRSAAVSSDVPVVTTKSSALQYGTRHADTAPFSGGASIQRDGSICSSGFGVTGSDGRRYLTTAWHCGAGTWTTPQGVTIGNSAPTSSTTHDTQLIATNSSSRVYNGDGFGGNSQFTNPVIGAGANHGGDMLCMSGAETGTVCNLVIRGQGVVESPNGTKHRVHVADQLDGVGTGGGGDSGGPIFAVAGDGSSVEARGTFSMFGSEAENQAPCQGQPGRQCSWHIYFTDITAALTELGARLNVG